MQKNPCFVLVHAKTFLSAEELRQLYDMARYQKWNLLLLESYAAQNRFSQEDHRLFDNDLCELILENPEKNI